MVVFLDLVFPVEHKDNEYKTIDNQGLENLRKKIDLIGPVKKVASPVDAHQGNHKAKKGQNFGPFEDICPPPANGQEKKHNGEKKHEEFWQYGHNKSSHGEKTCICVIRWVSVFSMV